MSLKRFHMMIWITIVSVLSVAACAPTTSGGISALGNNAGTAVPTLTGQSASNQTQGGIGHTVDVTPMSDKEMASQPQGQTSPGAAGTGGVQPGAPDDQPASTTKIIYSDSTYKFQVSYPSNFVFRIKTADKLADLSPKPITAFTFMNPSTAASDVIDLELADLEVRVYAAGQATALTNWLTSAGLLSADNSVPLQPFQAANIAGVQVCTSIMIVPNCSYFVMNNGQVYQLISVTLDGDAMAKTFKVLP